jgi:hypothetical protein
MSVDIIEKINSDRLREAIKKMLDEGYHVSYLIMSEDTFALLKNNSKTIIANCWNGAWGFYGVPIAICGIVPAGRVELVDEI